MQADLSATGECRATSQLDLLSSKATNIVARSAATAGRVLDEISIGGLLGRMLDAKPYWSSTVRRR